MTTASIVFIYPEPWITPAELMFDPVWTHLHINEVTWKVTFLFFTLCRNLSGDCMNPGQDVSASCFSGICDGLSTGWAPSSPPLGSFTSFCLMLFCLHQGMKFGSSDNTHWSVSGDSWLGCVLMMTGARDRHFLFTPERAASSQALLCSHQWGAAAGNQSVKIKPLKYMTIKWRPRNKTSKA